MSSTACGCDPPQIPPFCLFAICVTPVTGGNNMLMSIHCSRRYCHKFKTGTDHFLLIMSSPLRCKLNKSGHNHSCNRFILLIVILCNPAVNPNQANCQHLQRRNLKWLTATITALTYCSSPYVAPPFCRPTYTAVNLKGGT